MLEANHLNKTTYLKFATGPPIFDSYLHLSVSFNTDRRFNASEFNILFIREKKQS